MNRGLRRPLIALVVAVVVVGAWVGAPLMAAPADPAGLAGSPGVVAANVGPSPRASGADPSARPSPASARPSASADSDPADRHRGAPAATPRVNRPITAPASAAARLGQRDAAPASRPRRPSRAAPGEIRDPGHLGLDPVRRRLHLARRRRPGRRRRQAKGDRRHRLPRGERLEDVHRGADPRPRRGRPARPRRLGAVVPADARRSPGRSRSASCSTTPAGCATSTSTRASTRRCSPGRPASGTRPDR